MRTTCTIWHLTVCCKPANSASPTSFFEKSKQYLVSSFSFLSVCMSKGICFGGRGPSETKCWSSDITPRSRVPSTMFPSSRFVRCEGSLLPHKEVLTEVLATLAVTEWIHVKWLHRIICFARFRCIQNFEGIWEIYYRTSKYSVHMSNTGIKIHEDLCTLSKLCFTRIEKKLNIFSFSDCLVGAAFSML